MSEDISNDNDGVAIPEEFQQKVHMIVSEAENREQCDFIHSCASKKEFELSKAEARKSKGKNPQTMGSFDVADMPAD